MLAAAPKGVAGHESTRDTPLLKLRVRLPKGICSLPQDSDVVIDQILAWDNGVFREDLGALPEALQADVRSALRDFLDL